MDPFILQKLIPQLLMLWQHKECGPWFNIKMLSYPYRISHWGDKTILRPSYLHNEISYTGKKTSLYWIRAQDISIRGSDLVLPQYTIFSTRKITTLRLRQNGRHFINDIFKCIFLNENVWMLMKICLQIVLRCSIKNIAASFQIMAWHLPCNKPLSEPKMI